MSCGRYLRFFQGLYVRDWWETNACEHREGSQDTNMLVKVFLMDVVVSSSRGSILTDVRVGKYLHTYIYICIYMYMYMYARTCIHAY